MTGNFKRAISSLLAFVMLCSCVCIANVSSVLAATETTTTWDFSTNGLTSSISASTQIQTTDTSTLKDTGDTKVILVNSGNVWLDQGDLNLKQNSVVWLPLQASTKSVKLSDCSVNSDSSRYVLVGDTSKGYKLANIAAGTSYEVTIKDITGNTVTDSSNNVYLPITSYGNYKTSKFVLTEYDEVIQSANGKVSLTVSGETSNGSVSVSVGSNTPPLTESGKYIEANGGDKVEISVSTNTGYLASVKVNGESVDNAYSFEVDGDAAIAVEISKAYDRTKIISTTAYKHTTETDALVLEAGALPNKEHVFDLTTGAVLEAAKRININKGDKDSYSVLFETGDLSNKEAVLKVNFASTGTSGARTLNLIDVTNSKTTSIGTTPGTSEAQYKGQDSDEQVLSSNTVYCLTSANSGLCIYTIEITVNAVTTVTPTFTIDGTTQTKGTFYIDGTEYAVDASIVAKQSSYAVVFVAEDGSQYQGTLTIENGSASPVALMAAAAQSVTGAITLQGGAAAPSITVSYTNKTSGIATSVTTTEGADSYTVNLAPGTYSVSVTDISGYTLSSLSIDDFQVSAANTNENFNNILYKKNVAAATAKDVYVSKSATGDNCYSSVSEAIAAIKASSLTSSASDKWIVHIAPGTYREQIIIDADNVTLVCDSNGSLTDSETGAVLTWYYGVGYKYYSIKPNGSSDSVSYPRGYYDIEYAYDKHSMATADRWGAAVRVTGNNFLAEGIDFESSFNRYLTDEEQTDGLVPAKESEYGGSSEEVKLPARTASNVSYATATERAAALVLDGAKAELYNCTIKSSQDTLYVNKGTYYLNNCTVQGQTDYIFGDSSNAVFDNCTLVWAGYTNGTKAGHITAARGNMLFRNCTISNSNDISGSTVTPGYLGRHWGPNAKVIFADTKGMDATTLVASTTEKQIAYFENPSSLTKTMVTESSGTTQYDVREYYAATNAVYSGEKYTEATAITSYSGTQDIALTAEDVGGAAYLGSWTPVHYAFAVAESGTKTAVWDFTTPNPAELANVSCQSTTTELASTYEGIAMKVDATNGKLAYDSGAKSAQFNSGTIIKVPVYAVGDTVNVVAYSSSYCYYTIGSSQKTADGVNETYTATEADLSNGYVAITSTGSSYINTITLTTSNPPTAVTTTTVTWDFNGSKTSRIANAAFEGTKGFILPKDSSDNNLNIGIVLDVDTSSGKLNSKARSNNKDAQFTTGAVIKVPVFAEGDTVNVVSNGSYNYYTIAGVQSAGTDQTYTVTSEDAANKYVEIKSTGDAYLYSITLTTTAAPTAQSVFEYHTAAASGSKVYVVGKVAQSDTANADSVGFVAGLTEDAYLKVLDTATVAASVADPGSLDEITAEGSYLAAFELDGVSAGFVVIPFTTVGNVTVFGTAANYTYTQ